MDVGSIGAVCNSSLNEQGLLAGLMAMVPGLESKPIEAVENACASGGQAILSVAQKLRLGEGDVNWPEVRKALNEIGFSGWATREGRDDSLEDTIELTRKLLG